MTELKRLNKFISETGYCSRREADAIIESGRVTVNGNIAEMGTKVSNEDEVLVDGRSLKAKPKRVIIAYNKPVGVTCTTESKIKSNIVKAVNYHERIFPIGPLDRPSEGLIFLTNEGDIVNKILRAGNNHEKEYVVEVDKPIDKHFIDKMSGGIPILGTITKRCKVKKMGEYRFSIILTQGLNRQIRRMCEYLNYEVTSLKRVRIMNINLNGLRAGEWRLLTDSELRVIDSAVENSAKTAEGSVDPRKRDDWQNPQSKKVKQAKILSKVDEQEQQAQEKPSRFERRRDDTRQDKPQNTNKKQERNAPKEHKYKKTNGSDKPAGPRKQGTLSLKK
ncbi:23S rRNA pseudouridine(2604) synthase RluF [Pseudoalteromonas xiamenensis]